MSIDFLLPDLGEGLTESEIVSWHVGVGDDVALNQIIAEVETAKAIVELPSPYAGTVARLYAEPGVVVNVGEPIVAFDVEAAAPHAAPMPDAPMPDAPKPAVDDPDPGPGSTASESEAAAGSPDELVPSLPREPALNLVGYGALAESAAARRRPRRPDLAVPEPELAAPIAGAETVRETRTPIRSVRKHTAAAMVRSAFTAPHVTEFLTVDVTETMAFSGRLDGDRSLAGVRIGVLAVTARAVCLALGRHPSLNASWDEERQEIVEYHYVNLGIAAATPRGLVVPNIPDAERLPLADLAGAIRQLAETARAGRTATERLAGGTISITNIGVFGIDAGTPLLNPGEAAILAMGAVRREPREHDSGVALREVMTLSLSFDHRLVDGEQGSRFLAEVGGILRDPARALLLG